jgi:phage terminase large subunit-like protein
MVEFGQGTTSMSSPTKQLMTLVLQRNISHLDNPVMRWMADNIVVTSNAAGDIKPNKEKCREKIDGIVALVMALGRGLLKLPNKSVYSERGIIRI